MPVKACRFCGLLNPDTALACDCGVAFLKPSRESVLSALGAARLRARQRIMRGLLGLGLGLVAAALSSLTAFPRAILMLALTGITARVVIVGIHLLVLSKLVNAQRKLEGRAVMGQSIRMTFDRLIRGHRPELPGYRILKKTPSTPLPTDLASSERNETFRALARARQEELRRPPYKPPADTPLFISILDPRPKEGSKRGLLTIVAPDRKGRCLLLFSSLWRAADYAQVRLSSWGSLHHYLSTTPEGAVRMLSDCARNGIASFAIDRCPRCTVFAAVKIAADLNANQLVEFWSVSKGYQCVRADLYFEYALQSARDGRLQAARDVALEAVGHVTLEDPRFHLLLGQLALKTRDRHLLREAETFLRALRADVWTRKLDDLKRSRNPDFKGPAWVGTTPGGLPTSGWS